MAWIFTGSFPGGRDHKSRKDTYGPMPIKRWVPHPSDPKRHKFTYRRGAGPRSSSPSIDSQAEAYARWLAARDGITIPADAVARATFATVSAPSSKNVMRGESRPFQVQFCKVTESGRWGVPAKVEALVTVNLPNWDWVPAPAVEEIEEAPRTGGLFIEPQATVFAACYA